MVHIFATFSTFSSPNSPFSVTKGDFEEGYRIGFLDAQKLPSGAVAKRYMDEEYGSMRGDFHAGYVQGLRDAGMQGLSQSMQHLAMSRGPRDINGYSSGYMQVIRVKHGLQ